MHTMISRSQHAGQLYIMSRAVAWFVQRTSFGCSMLLRNIVLLVGRSTLRKSSVSDSTAGCLNSTSVLATAALDKIQLQFFNMGSNSNFNLYFGHNCSESLALRYCRIIPLLHTLHEITVKN